MAKSLVSCFFDSRCTRLMLCHWRRQGGGGRGPSPQWPGKKERKGDFYYFYQMSNMYTCIAYLIEIRKFCSKNLVHKGVHFEAQNALKLTYQHL